MLPPKKTLCVALFLALTNKFVDAFLFSTCEITACDLREKVSAIKDTLDSHTGQMAKLVDVQHMVDKMKRGMYYQQQQIESLQKKLEDAVGSTRKTRDEDSNRGRTSDNNSDSLPSSTIDEKYITIIKRLDHDTTNLSTQVSLLWTQNRALAQELANEKRRSDALLWKLGERNNISDTGTSNQITIPKFEKLVQPKNNSNYITRDSNEETIDQRNAYEDQDLLELNNSLFTTQYEKITTDSSKRLKKKSGRPIQDSKQAPPDLIILKTEQRLRDIEHKLLGLDGTLNTSHLGNTIESLNNRLDNVHNKSEVHKYEMDTVQQQVDRVTKMSLVLNNKINFMNRCLVNITENMAKLTVAENFSKVDILEEIKDLQEQMGVIEDLKSDVIFLKNGSTGHILSGKLEALDNDTFTSDYIESIKLKVINSVMQQMGDVFNKTFEKHESADHRNWAEIGDGLKNSTQSATSGGDLISSVEWLKNSTLSREELSKALKDLLDDGQNRSISERMKVMENMLLTINSSTVMKLTELKKEVEYILNMIVKHVVREQIKEEGSKEVEEPPVVSKLIDVVEGKFQFLYH